jgi:hypothetical protein
MMMLFQLINDNTLKVIRELVSYIINDPYNLYEIRITLINNIMNKEDKIKLLDMLDLTKDTNYGQ